MTKRIVSLIFVSLAAMNCQKNDEPLASVQPEEGSATLQSSNSAQLFSDNVGSFEVMVYYEIGADPYTGNISGTATPVWDLTKKSFAALFNNHVGRFLFVPNIIGQMIQIPDQMKVSWSSADLIKLGRQYAPDLMQSGDARITIIFLNGRYNSDANVLGYHQKGSQFAFVFKDSVIGAGGNPKAQAYIEQSVVVHELSHVAGLVNNGVPMITNHEDPSHPKHSLNVECASNWKFENKSTILSAVTNAVASNRQILFGSETLIDGRSYHP